MFSSSVRRFVPVGVRLRVRRALLETPVAGQLYSWAHPQLRPLRVRRSSELVIDGFPRSGNSYARAAFLYANGPDRRVSSHLHSRRAVARAVRLRRPTVVLIREPRAAIASGVAFDPTVAPSLVAAHYLRYYRAVARLAPHVVIATFDEVIADFGAVLERCNARFGTTFTPYRESPEALAWIRTHIDTATLTAYPVERFEAVVPRPIASRALIFPAYDREGLRRLAAAQRCYERVLQARDAAQRAGAGTARSAQARDSGATGPQATR